MRPLIGIFGGRFDPIHHGHLQLAAHLQHCLELDRVDFLPTGQPPHRGPAIASKEQRRKMLELALQQQRQNHWQIDDRELQRAAPSYTIDSLNARRRETPDACFCLLMGGDSFATLTRWQHWQQLLQQSHIAVVNRPGQRLPEPAIPLQTNGIAEARIQMRQQQAGCQLLLPMPDCAISSSNIRRAVAADQPLHDLLPNTVADYIQSNALYR